MGGFTKTAYWCPLNLFLFPLFFVSLDLDDIFVYHSQHSSLSHVCFDYEWRVKPSKRWCSWFQNEETKDAYSWICQNRPLCQNLQNGSYPDKITSTFYSIFLHLDLTCSSAGLLHSKFHFVVGAATFLSIFKLNRFRRVVSNNEKDTSIRIK